MEVVYLVWRSPVERYCSHTDVVTFDSLHSFLLSSPSLPLVLVSALVSPVTQA